MLIPAPKLSIDYNHTEKVQVLFTNVAIQAWFKYSFGYNANIDSAKTKKIVWYFPSEIIQQIDAAAEIVNGLIYNNWPFFQYTLVSIAKRGGGYYCIDRPLVSFMQSAVGIPVIAANGSSVGHYFMELDDWEVDITNSYIKFSQQQTADYYVLNLFFELQPQ